MVRAYLDSRPDPDIYEFLRYDFEDLDERYGGVVGTTFRTFPSFPQRYHRGHAASSPNRRAGRPRRAAEGARRRRSLHAPTTCTCASSARTRPGVSSAPASTARPD